MQKFETFQKLKKCIQKVPFCVLLHRKNVVISFFCASSKSMTLNSEFYHAYKFELKRWIVSKSEKKVQNVSEFKKFNIRKISIEIGYNLKRYILHFSCSFERQDLKFIISQCVRILRKHNLTYTTCQTLNQTLENVSEFEKSLHSKGHFMKYVTRRKRILLQLPCFSDNREFKIIKLWIALELCVGFPKKSLHSRNHALDYVSPTNDFFCLFRVSFKSLSLN